MSDVRAILQQEGISTPTWRVALRQGALEIGAISVPGAHAVLLWRKLRTLVDKTGCWPVIVGEKDALDFHQESMELEGPEATADILQEGQRMSPAECLKELAARGEGEEGEEDLTDEEGDDDEAEPAGPLEEFMIPKNIMTGKPLPEVFIVLVPVKNGWEVPAILRFGDWNDCPPPEAHVCLLKHWNEEYGAELVGLSQDVLEMHVGAPPTDDRKAELLAREHYIYCADIVEQGTGSIQGLARTLKGSSVWYFWWD